MEHSEHVLLARRGAEQFAKTARLRLNLKTTFSPGNGTTNGRKPCAKVLSVGSPDDKFGTVGAVALDNALAMPAAATSNRWNDQQTLWQNRRQSPHWRRHLGR